MTSISRRSMLKTAAAAGGAGLLAPWALRDALAQSGTLKVTHFGGPYEALGTVVGKPFADAGLGKAEFSASLSPATMGQLQANKGNAPYDVVMFSRPAAVRAGNAKLIDKNDTAKLPNLKQVQPQAVGREGFGVPFLIDTVELMYNTKMVDKPITSWLDLWRPELKGKIALPSTSVNIAADFIVLIARALGGNEKDPKAIDEAFKKIAELKGSVRTFTANPVQASTLMERGEIAVTPQFGVRVSSVLKNAPDVTRVFPKEGVAARPYDFCVATGSSNKDLAYKFIDFVISTKVQEAMAAEFLAPVPNKQVNIPANLKEKILTDYNKMLFLDETFMAANQRPWMTRWERTIQSG